MRPQEVGRWEVGDGSVDGMPVCFMLPLLYFSLQPPRATRYGDAAGFITQIKRNSSPPMPLGLGPHARLLPTAEDA